MQSSLTMICRRCIKRAKRLPKVGRSHSRRAAGREGTAIHTWKSETMLLTTKEEFAPGCDGELGRPLYHSSNQECPTQRPRLITRISIGIQSRLLPCECLLQLHFREVLMISVLLRCVGSFAGCDFQLKRCRFGSQLDSLPHTKPDEHEQKSIRPGVLSCLEHSPQI